MEWTYHLFWLRWLDKGPAREMVPACPSTGLEATQLYPSVVRQVSRQAASEWVWAQHQGCFDQILPVCCDIVTIFSVSHTMRQ